MKTIGSGRLETLYRDFSWFRWRCQDGRVLTIDQMETRHIFNCMKMCYNHLAAEQGMKLVWFNRYWSDYAAKGKKSPESLAVQIVFFYQVIEARGDLPEYLNPPYAEILEQLRGVGLEDIRLGPSVQRRSNVLLSDIGRTDSEDFEEGC